MKMKEKSGKLLGLGVAVLLLAAMMIAGCNQAQGNSSREENKKPDTPAAAEKYTVTISAGSNGKVTLLPLRFLRIRRYRRGRN